MAITRKVTEMMPGVGHATEYVSSEGVNNPINATTTTTLIPTGNPFRSGKWRVRGIAYPGAGAGQCTAIKVTVTDGSATHVLAILPSFAASDLFNVGGEFGPLEIAATSISFAVTMANVANGQLTADFEVGVNP